MLWTAVLCLGIQQADWRFDIWPNSTSEYRIWVKTS
jgi:hypothetical protein